MRTLKSLGILLGALAAWGQAVAQDPDLTIPNDYATQQPLGAAGGRNGSALFGESIDLYTGSTEFSFTDVSIPGNSGLPVEFRRRFKAYDDGDGVYGGWETEIPYMHGIFAHRPGYSTGWTVADPVNINKRCTSDFHEPPESTTGYGNFFAFEFSHGIHLYVPGLGDAEMGWPNGGTNLPTDGATYSWATKHRWYFSCKKETANGVPGEGFIARAPDGKRYTFDWIVWHRSIRAVTKPFEPHRPPGAAVDVKPDDTSVSRLTRAEFRILPTRIEDQFGNWVQYTYSGSRLTNILSNDGRQLSVTYVSDPFTRLATVSDGTRTWSYDAQGNLTFPDGSTRTLLVTTSATMATPYSFSCDSAFGTRPTAPMTIALKVPSGATATYTFDNLKRGLSFVPWDMNCYAETINYPAAFNGWSIKSKVVTGPGLTSQAWNYTYGPSNECFVNGPFHPCTASSPTTRTLEVTGPESSYVRYTFGNKFLNNEGKLLKVERGSSSLNIVETDDYTWQLTSTGSYVDPVTTGSDSSAGTSFPAIYTHPLKKVVRSVQGTAFTMEVNAWDSFTRPSNVSRYSGSWNRNELPTYYNDTGRWVISQLASLTVNGKVERQFTYDPASAKVASVSAFGKLQQSRTYAADGTLLTIRDGANNATTFTNYKRGIAQLITYPGSVTKSLIANDQGWITSATDELGYATGYGYDPMGRISSISYPGGDVVGWAGTTIQYAQVPSAEYGIQAGHWRRLETTGNRIGITYFDALSRPILEERYDSSDVANTASLVRSSYDGQGRDSFVSYPVRFAASLGAITVGTRTYYDSLDRPTSSSADSELGALTTTYAYLAGFQRRITNSRGYVTTQSFQAFDVPSMDTLTLASEPGGVTTTIGRDVFGKPTSINRTGSYNGQAQSMTHSYVYDANELLCKTYAPEEGTTYFDYDAAGNLAWSANGLVNDGTGCVRANAPVSSRTYRGYDGRNRLLTINRPEDAYFDSTFSYFADGALQTAATLATTTSYQYNKRRLIELETTQVVGPGLNRSFTLDWGYNTLGDASSLVYPDGYLLTYNPNALGQARQATGTFGGVNASPAVQYHPNGAIASFTYGNGITHTLTLNTRQLPQRSLDASGGNVVTDYTLTYDANGNVGTISDGRPGQPEQRALGYDARDRVTSADAPNQFQAERYEYDALDNLRRMQMGPTTGYWIDFVYQYDAYNRLASINNFGSPWSSYTYDTRGNVASRTSQAITQYFNFDSGNRMQYVSGGRYPIEYYAYNGLGMRSVVDRYTSQSQRNFQVYSQAGQLLYEEDNRVGEPGNGKRKRYIMLGGTTVARHETPVTGGATQVFYTHNSVVGSAHYETDSAGAQVFSQPLAPYGSIYSGTYTDRQGFTGHMTDGNTQLTYMQQRYYDPIAMRFLSVDPAGEGFLGLNLNRYWYANNNPYGYVDPDGRAGKVAWVVKLGADSMKKLARVTREQAVAARKAEQNVVADRRQIASQIETAAHGEAGQLKHAAHELDDGSKGLPHYQTEGVRGHSFWGKLSIVALATAAALDRAAEAAEYIPDPTPRIAEQADVDRWNNITGMVGNAIGVDFPKAALHNEPGLEVLLLDHETDTKGIDQ